MNEHSSKKFQQQMYGGHHDANASGPHSQINMPLMQNNSGSLDHVQNIGSYQKQIKSNNQVFKQSTSLHGHIQTALQQKQQQNDVARNTYNNQVSPNNDKFRKTTNQQSNQFQNKGSAKDIKYGTQYGSTQKNRNKIGTQPGGQKQLQTNINHRRSKTDGTIQVAVDMENHGNNNQNPDQASLHQISQSRAQQLQELSMQMHNDQQQRMLNDNMPDSMIQNNYMSRQQAINSNQNMYGNKSNQGAKSAQIQMSQAQKSFILSKQKNDSNNNGAGGNRNLSVEQAAKNLKLIGGTDDVMQAPTRNSNLTSQPNKDKMAKNKINKDGSQNASNGSQFTLQNKKLLIEAQMQQQDMFQKSKQYELPNQEFSPKIDSNMQDEQKQANISMDQLKELMKNPQIAQFLKEQIEIQQWQQQSYQKSQESFGVQSMKKLDNQGAFNNKKDSLDQSHQQSTKKMGIAVGELNQASNQKIGIAVGHSESNMNSDTSQEILKYQQEWAKQFHEQVTGMTNIERQELNAMMTANSNNTAGQRSSQCMDRDQSSSQFITGNHGNSHEQIMMLPESAYTHNMQKLNEKINDTQTGPMTSVSTKLPGRHLPQSMTDSQPQDKGQSNIDFYNQQQLPSESQVESQSPMSHALQMKELGVDSQNTGSEGLNSNIKQAEMPMSMQEQEQGSRNIMNGGKQLSFITVCSDVMDHDADLIQDNLREDSQASQKDEDDEYLTFQLCQGEVMDNEMANFIGIHMLNDGYLEGEQNSKNADQDGGLNFQCQVTGAHFEFNDIHERVRVLLDKRNVIDEAIRQEDERQKLVKNQQVLNKLNKQKQLQKQKKFKTQVQNILKSAQQDNLSNDDYGNDLNDSIPNQHTNHMMTDEDMFVMEDEDHVEKHHVTANMKTNKVNLENQQENSQKSGNQVGNGGKIYNTHDGRLKQAQEQQSTYKGTNNVQTQDYNNQQPIATRAFKSSGQKGQAVNTFASSQNQVKMMMANQTNENEIKNSLISTNKQNYSVKAVISHGHTVQGRFYNNQYQQKEKLSGNQITTMKTSNQSMYPSGGSFYQQSLKNNAKTFHVNPSQAVHQASSLASDHASKISQMGSKNSVAVTGTLTGKSQRIQGNSFGAIGQNNSKGGFAYTQNSGNNSNERNVQRKLQIGGAPAGLKRGGINVSVGSGTHAKIDQNKQYNVQIKNQQQQDAANQGYYGGKKQQLDGQHQTSVTGNSNHSIGQRMQISYPEGNFDNNGVKQMFVSQGEKIHGRVLSDDIKFNTSNIQKSTFQAGIAGTQVHSNQLSSLDATNAQNTHAYNTALASQRDTIITTGKMNANKNPKKNVTSFDNHKNSQKINVNLSKGTGKARVQENKDSKSLGATMSTQGNSQLKQTAQFGPQMNLTKSQLPTNNVKGNGQSQYHSNDNKVRQQKKILVNNQKGKSTEIRKNSKHVAHGESGSSGFVGGYLRDQYQSQGIHDQYTGVVLQNQGQSPIQYDENGSLNKRQPMMQPQNQITYFNNQGLLVTEKRQAKQANSFGRNEQKGISSNKSDNASQSHQSTSGQHVGQGASIYTTQQQRKQKLISNGGNLIGYDMGRAQNQQQLGQQSNAANTQYQAGYGLNRNISIDRTSLKSKQYSNQNVMLNQIDIKNQSNIAAVIHPKTVQSVSKKFAATSHGGQNDASDLASQSQAQTTSGQLFKQGSNKVNGIQSFINKQSMKEPSPAGQVGIGTGNHLQSHSFDLRQQQRAQVNRIGNYSGMRDGNQDEQSQGKTHHKRQPSGVPTDFNAQHAQSRYQNPNQAVRPSNVGGKNVQGINSQHSNAIGKGNLRSFDAQTSGKQHNKLISEGLNSMKQVTPGSSNIQTPSQIIQKNKRGMAQQQANYNQRNNGSQLGGTNISKTKSTSLGNKKDGQNSSNSAVRTVGQIGEQTFNRYSGGGTSGKQLSNIHQGGTSQQQQMQLIKQGQTHMRQSLNQRGQPGSNSFANTGPNNNFERARDSANPNVANAITTKSKRLNAANRGINSGTNARVNTFDNRGMQAQQQNQNQKGQVQGNNTQQMLNQMMNQPQIDQKRGQMSNQMGGQYASNDSNGNPMSHSQMVENTNAIMINNQRQQQQQQQYLPQNSNIQYSGGSQQNEPQQMQNMDQSANGSGQHQSPILFAKFVNQFFLQ